MQTHLDPKTQHLLFENAKDLKREGWEDTDIYYYLLENGFSREEANRAVDEIEDWWFSTEGDPFKDDSCNDFYAEK